MALDAIPLEQPVHREAVEAGLVDRRDPDDPPTRASALAFARSRSTRRAFQSPPLTACLDILSPPGGSTVANHVDLLSSSDTNSVARSESAAVWTGFARAVVQDIDRPRC